uniref:Rap guanine nucleotide exchange factor 1 n=1 Tax=Anolis carolinensis TaxID=28377 RepID=H9GKD1_ANOCA
MRESCAKLNSDRKAFRTLSPQNSPFFRLRFQGDDGPDVRGGSGDILLVHATETDRKDLVLYCEAFLTTYRTFISPEELIKKLQYRYEKFCHCPDTFKKRVSKNTFFVLVRVVDELCLVELSEELLRLLMALVFRLVCSGELSLARVLRKNILDKAQQKKILRHNNSARPLASRWVAARPGTLHDFHSHEIAEQLTLLDAELFYKIEIPEVLLWAKEQNEEKSPNLTQFTEHFNNMSYWVRSHHYAAGESAGPREAAPQVHQDHEALAEAQQLQLLPGHPLGAGLGPHPPPGVAEADLGGPGRVLHAD